MKVQGSPAVINFHHNQESGEVMTTLLSTLCLAKRMVSVTLQSGAVGMTCCPQVGLRLIHSLSAPWYVPILLATSYRVLEEKEIMTRTQTGILHFTHKLMKY